MILPLLSLALAVICYAISQLQQHGKLKWSNGDFGFWGIHSDKRKYKWSPVGENQGPKFFLSTTWLAFLTDGYHHMQFWMFNFLALSFTLTKEWDWYLFISLMIGIRVVHWIGRRLFSK